MFISPIRSGPQTGPLRPAQGALPVGAVEAVRPVTRRDAAGDSVFSRSEEAAAVLNLSDAGRKMAQQAAAAASEAGDTEAPVLTGDEQAPPAAAATESRDQDPQELTAEEEEQVSEMQDRDQEVRVHEQAHKSAGGQHTGSIHLDMQRGPDGKSYAVGGHVDIDVSPVAGDPAATVSKMQQVIRAALAPAEPSSADRGVAAKATAQASEARRELAEDTQPEGAGAPSEGARSEHSSHEQPTLQAAHRAARTESAPPNDQASEYAADKASRRASLETRYAVALSQQQRTQGQRFSLSA